MSEDSGFDSCDYESEEESSGYDLTLPYVILMSFGIFSSTLLYFKFTSFVDSNLKDLFNLIKREQENNTVYDPPPKYELNSF